MRRATAATLFSGLVCGCAVPLPPGPAPQAIELPAAWSADPAAFTAGAARLDDEALRSWWRRFGDAQLDDWQQRALSGNARIQLAQAAWLQARAQRDAAVAALSPTLDASVSAQRGRAGGQSTGNRLESGLQGRWAPDVFGAQRSAVDAAEAAVAVVAATLGDTQVQVAAEVTLAWLQLRGTMARQVIARENLASQQETLQITDWRHQAGLVSLLALEQARAAVAQTEALLPALLTLVQQRRHALAVLAGLPPAALALPEIEASDLVRQPQALADTFVPDAPADTLRRRADVRAAEYEVAAALALVDQAEALRRPSFSIGGSLGLSAVTLGAMTQGASVVASLLGGISLPIFDGGAGRAQVLAQQAALAQAQQRHRAAVLGALQQVEDALVALRGDRLRLQSLSAAAAAAARAADIARLPFGSGLVDFQTVLETQRTQFSTQDAVVGAATDIGIDHVNLFKALGGGWRPLPITDLP